jgi:hypothetical protein
MRLILLPAFASCLFSIPAFGWGCEGHQMIALIARAHLTPAASAEVDQLLREHPIDPKLNRFCKDRPSDLMADSSTWADDARQIEKTADWHFIDIPVAVPSIPTTDLMQWCKPTDGKPGCIVTAIEYESKILKDRTRSGADRATALRYLIHFTGDLSQPLHASDNHDRGGNCTSVHFFSHEKPENLHAIWDYSIIEKELADKNVTQTRYAADLDRTFANRWPDWGASKTDATAWAWDSHALAVSVTYADLKPPIPIAPVSAGLADAAACDAGKATVEALHIQIGAEYTNVAFPVIRQQLAKAGYRLAGLLNQTFNQ